MVKKKSLLPWTRFWNYTTFPCTPAHAREQHSDYGFQQGRVLFRLGFNLPNGPKPCRSGWQTLFRTLYRRTRPRFSKSHYTNKRKIQFFFRDQLHNLRFTRLRARAQETARNFCNQMNGMVVLFSPAFDGRVSLVQPASRVLTFPVSLVSTPGWEYDGAELALSLVHLSPDAGPPGVSTVHQENCQKRFTVQAGGRSIIFKRNYTPKDCQTLHRCQPELVTLEKSSCDALTNQAINYHPQVWCNTDVDYSEDFGALQGYITTIFYLLMRLVVSFSCMVVSLSYQTTSMCAGMQTDGGRKNNSIWSFILKLVEDRA